jgi:hypothetical protein
MKTRGCALTRGTKDREKRVTKKILVVKNRGGNRAAPERIQDAGHDGENPPSKLTTELKIGARVGSKSETWTPGIQNRVESRFTKIRTQQRKN